MVELTILNIFNDEQVSNSEYSLYKIRNSVRAILIDNELNIALIHSIKGNYYTLPGGGVENETLENAVIRESLEETGCNVEVVSYLGTVFQIWKEKELFINSSCFICNVIGGKGLPKLNDLDSDFEKESEVVWFSFSEVLKVFKTPFKQENLYQKYIRETDLKFLETYFQSLSKF